MELLNKSRDVKGVTKLCLISRKYVFYEGPPREEDKFSTSAVEISVHYTSGKLITLRQAVQLEETALDLLTVSYSQRVGAK